MRGNGGSTDDSERIVGELMKGFLSKREVTDERISKGLRKIFRVHCLQYHRRASVHFYRHL